MTRRLLALVYVLFGLSELASWFQPQLHDYSVWIIAPAILAMASALLIAMRARFAAAVSMSLPLYLAVTNLWWSLRQSPRLSCSAALTLIMYTLFMVALAAFVYRVLKETPESPTDSQAEHGTGR